MDGDTVGDEVGKASAAESLLRFSISLVTNLFFTLWEHAAGADSAERVFEVNSKV
jgi:hypothetical protein